MSAPMPPPQKFEVRMWDLGSGAVMTSYVPVKLSTGNIEKLKRYVAALEIEASISWDAVPGGIEKLAGKP